MSRELSAVRPLWPVAADGVWEVRRESRARPTVNLRHSLNRSIEQAMLILILVTQLILAGVAYAAEAEFVTGGFLVQLFIGTVVSASAWGIHRLIVRIDKLVDNVVKLDKDVSKLDDDMVDVFHKLGMSRRMRDL